MTNSYKSIQTLRYMGNKNKLLAKIVPEIIKNSDEGDTIVDLMAGTNSIGYALKERNKIISCDVQYYSYIVANCLLNNYSVPSKEKIHRDIDSFYHKNKIEHLYSFFVDNYVDTYFTYLQCEDIDSLRFAIENQTDFNLKSLYLTMLMMAMNHAESTTGHFAQYLDKSNSRVTTLRKMSIYDLFFSQIDSFAEFSNSIYKNECYNLDYKELFSINSVKEAKCFYLDPPYTSDQYSRFYHILETICKYDLPKLQYKAKYRTDRFSSNFCYKRKAEAEFEFIISKCSLNKSNLIISYSNHGVISTKKLYEICKKYYENANLQEIDYKHSSQGSGNINIKEILISCIYKKEKKQ